MTDTAYKKSLHRFRVTGIAEGVSFLLLLLVAMPLKYIFKIPEPVKIVGWAHGALFITYLYLAFGIMGDGKKSFVWFLKAAVASVVPLGTFIFDKRLKAEEAQLQ